MLLRARAGTSPARTLLRSSGKGASQGGGKPGPYPATKQWNGYEPGRGQARPLPCYEAVERLRARAGASPARTLLRSSGRGASQGGGKPGPYPATKQWNGYEPGRGQARPLPCYEAVERLRARAGAV